MKKSAGILLYRFRNGVPEFFLVHPGGPYWKNKDLAGWSIPKGEFDEPEGAEMAARREFEEETGFVIHCELKALPPVRQKGGKIIFAFAGEQDLDPEKIVSNPFEMEWPPRSGRRTTFPEIDKAGWFPAEHARKKMHSGQAALIDELLTLLQA